MRHLISTIVLCLVLTGTASAAEREEVCVKYRQDFGWSNGYRVIGNVMSGSELNRAVRSLTRYRSFSTYVVVFWDEGQASIFELPSGSMGNVPMFEREVEDQYGRKWRIKRGHSLCY